MISAISALIPATLIAATCSVPTSGHPTLGSASRDVSCTTVNLAAGTYAENVVIERDFAIAGAGSEISVVMGALEVQGPTTDVAISSLAIDGTPPGVAGCWPSLLRTTAGAHLVANDDVVVTNSGIANGPCRLFADGFESEGMLAWSAASP